MQEVDSRQFILRALDLVKKVYKKKSTKDTKSERRTEGFKKTGKVVHVVSKRTNQEESN